MGDSLLPPEILGLPVSERLVLVEQLWDSIAQEESTFELSTEQKAELDRRLERLQTNPNSGSPWEVVRQRLIDQA